MTRCDCPSCRSLFEPLRLRCHTPEIADAFRVILTAMGAGLKIEGEEEIFPYSQGDVVILPWAGRPEFVTTLMSLAMQLQVAAPEEIREMNYAAMAQALETGTEDVRTFGSRLTEAMTAFMRTVGLKKAVDIDGLLATFDEEIGHLQPRRKGEH